MDDDVERVRARLRAAGAGEAELAAATTLEMLFRLSGEMGLRPEGQPISLRAVAAAAGVDLAVAQGFLRAGGLPADAVDAAVWYPSDIEWIRAADAARTLFGDAAIHALMRRAGGAMAQLANAASSMFRVNLADTGVVVDPLAVVERNLSTRPLVDTLMDVLSHL